MRRRLHSLFLVLAVTLGAAGCSGEPEAAPAGPTSSPTSSETATPQPSPEPSEEEPTPQPLPLPEYPEDLTPEDTPENAIRAAEYFIALMNYAQSTGDIDAYLDVTFDTCESCKGFTEEVSQHYEAGGFLIGNDLSLQNPAADRTSDGLAWVVYADWVLSEGKQFDGVSGELTELNGARVKDHRIGVQLFDGDWRMLTFAKAAPK